MMNNLIDNLHNQKMIKGTYLPKLPHNWALVPNPAYQELANIMYKSMSPIRQQTKAIIDAIAKIPPFDCEMMHLCNQSLQIWQDIVNSDEWQQMYKMQSLFAEQLKSSAWIDLSKQLTEVTSSVLGSRLELYMDIQKQLSSYFDYESIHVASELSRQIAENLQTTCPLFSPEYIQTASRLVAAAGLSVDYEWGTSEFPDIADIDNITDEDEKNLKLTAFKEQIITQLAVPFSDSLPLESANTLGFYQVWLKVPEKAQFLEILLELTVYCYTMLFISESIPAFLKYASTVGVLIKIYRLGTCFLAPALITRYKETPCQHK